MIACIELLLAFLFPITFICFVIFAVLGATIQISNGGGNFLKDLRTFKIGIPSLIGTVAGFVLIFCLSSLKHKLLRDEVKQFFGTGSYTIMIKGQKLDSLGFALRKIATTSDNRNTGDIEIKALALNKTDTLKLRLQRSFVSPSKYWVYVENDPSTSENCIGEINTKLLDGY